MSVRLHPRRHRKEVHTALDQQGRFLLLIDTSKRVEEALLTCPSKRRNVTAIYLHGKGYNALMERQERQKPVCEACRWCLSRSACYEKSLPVYRCVHVYEAGTQRAETIRQHIHRIYTSTCVADGQSNTEKKSKQRQRNKVPLLTREGGDLT